MVPKSPVITPGGPGPRWTWASAGLRWMGEAGGDVPLGGATSGEKRAKKRVEQRSKHDKK